MSRTITPEGLVSVTTIFKLRSNFNSLLHRSTDLSEVNFLKLESHRFIETRPISALSSFVLLREEKPDTELIVARYISSRASGVVLDSVNAALQYQSPDVMTHDQVVSEATLLEGFIVGLTVYRDELELAG